MKLTRKQKIIIADALICAAGNLVEEIRCGDKSYNEELSEIPVNDIAQQLAEFLKNLPGDVWDNRLPQPLSANL